MKNTHPSHSNSTPLGILCLGGSCKNSAKPHWCWASDYYPGGFPMPNRVYSLGSYRYGHNQQESDAEITGNWEKVADQMRKEGHFNEKFTNKKTGEIVAFDYGKGKYEDKLKYYTEDWEYEGTNLRPEQLEWHNPNCE